MSDAVLPITGRLIITISDRFDSDNTLDRILDIDLNELGLRSAMYESILTWQWSVTDEDGEVTTGWSNLRVTRVDPDDIGSDGDVLARN